MSTVTSPEELAVTVLLQVPAIFEYRDLASRAVSTVCRHALNKTRPGAEARIAGEFINELMSAVGEAFNNIVEHAYEGTGNGMIEIELSWNQNRVTVKLCDRGQAFDFNAVLELDLDRAHEDGMGIHIIRSFADFVAYRPGSPNVLEISKLLPNENAASYPTG